MNPLGLFLWSGRFPRLIPPAFHSFMFLVALGTLFEGASLAATNTVTTLADSGSGSLRQVIAGSFSGDVIVFAVTGTINLAGEELALDKNLSIAGPGAAALVIDANHSSRVFSVRPNVAISISNLTFCHGLSQSGINGGAGAAGGCISNAGNLILNRCIISGSSAGSGASGNNGYLYGGSGGNGGEGGGIFNSGILVMTDCTISGNACGAGGRGGYAQLQAGSGGYGGGGGGIASHNSLAMSGCTIAENQSGFGGDGGDSNGFLGTGGSGGSGGGILASGFLSMTNCTIAQNGGGVGGRAGHWIFPGGGPGPDQPTGGGMGGSGGGLFVISGGTMVACTVANNAAGLAGPGNSDGFGGGIYYGGSPALCSVGNTLIAQNSGGTSDVYGGFASLGNNLIGVTNGATGFGGAGDLYGFGLFPLDPLIAPLTDNGGPTFTIALFPASPAIDAGNLVVSVDQRGIARPQGRGGDIGAYEFQFVIPQIRTAKFQSKTTFLLQICGLPNQTYTVQSSTNLLDWGNVAGCAMDLHGAGEFAHSNVDIFCNRFYRLRSGAP